MYYDRTDISEGIDLARSSNSKNVGFFIIVFLIMDSNYLCNGCHVLTMLCLRISDITFVTIKNIDYRCVIHNISKSEATNLFKNSAIKKYCLKFQSIQD